MSDLFEIAAVAMVEIAGNWLSTVHPAFIDLTSK